MKPLWTQTLAWIVAILIAILLALANPDSHAPTEAGAELELVPHGSVAPR